MQFIRQIAFTFSSSHDACSVLSSVVSVNAGKASTKGMDRRVTTPRKQVQNLAVIVIQISRACRNSGIDIKEIQDNPSGRNDQTREKYIPLSVQSMSNKVQVRMNTMVSRYKACAVPVNYS